MTKPTITTLGIATTFFLFFGLVLLYAFVTVRSQKVETMNLRTTLAEQTTKQAAARTIEGTVAVTESVRTELTSYFLSEKETISFIAEIEGLAGAVGVSVQTTSLDIDRPAEGNAQLKTGFAVEGSRTAVMTFMKAIETLPYHSRMQMMRIENGKDGVWQGQVDIFVTLTL